MAIYIICGEPGCGKTKLMTYIARERAFDRERNRAMRNEVANMQMAGFNVTCPSHNVCANFDLKLHKFGYSMRRENRINPYRLGFQNMTDIKLHYIAPYSTIFITEGQKYLDARLSRYFPAFQSRWYEAHRHWDLDIFIDVQRADLIDLNVRSLAVIIEVQSTDNIYNDYSKRIGALWNVRIFKNIKEYDAYCSSGRKDSSFYEEKIIVADCDVCSMYDTKSCRPKFIAGHIDEDFVNNPGSDCGNTPEEIIAYLKRYDDELPEGFFETNKKVTL